VLVAFEGIDGSGKSTLIRRVAQQLRRSKVDIVVTAEPTTTPLGRLVRRGIQERFDPLLQAGLFLTDRALHALQLAPDLLSDCVVLTDRYADSTTAYQAVALDGRVPQPLENLHRVQRAIFPRPDLVILLDLPPEAALRRIRGRRVKEQYERQRFLARVRANYRKLARQDPDRWLVLDAQRPVAELAREVVGAIESRLVRRTK
jgi:dTMP kinase